MNREGNFLIFVTDLARAFAAAAFLICGLSALAKPREPGPPLPESAPVLYHESFDEIYLFRMTNAEWVIPNYGTLTESWSAYALQRAGVVTPFIVPGLDAAGHTNIASEGALRLWVKAYWSSAPDGTGPGTDARLVELALVGGEEAAAVWWLQVSPEGTLLSLVSQGETGPVTLLKAEICWQAGQWHQIALHYAAQGTTLYVDGEPAGVGAGTWQVPPQMAALVWGSSWTGADSIGGELEELFTFSRPLEDAFNYSALKAQAALGPITLEEEQAAAELRAKWKAEREARGEAEVGGPPMLRLEGPTSECITNAPIYMTNTVSVFDTNQGWTVTFDVQGTNGPVDIFTTTNLVGESTNNPQWTWLEQGPTCSTYQYTNQPDSQSFYILGLTNDGDGGGLSDAYERLVTHGDVKNSDDDRVVPLLSIYVTDSVAAEQQSTNTARFVITRLGGFMGLPLTVGCQVSGTASNGTDYYLSPVTTTSTNVLVTFPPSQTSVELTLAPGTDSLAEGTEYATLTLTTNVSTCEVSPAHPSATAWILEQYTRVYTLNSDFNLGALAGLEAASNQLQFKTNLPAQFPFINVACSDITMGVGRGTVVRINTTNGMIIGEYRTAPAGIQPDPSRTTVDQFGNVWVANREDTRTINGTNYGAITRIGLVLGPRFSKTNSMYFPDPNGQYINVTNATYNTCHDRDGDGYIRTSAGLADILPWSNQREGLTDVDSNGGVSTAEDEAITEYVRVDCTGTRTIAVDKFNDIWVGGHLDSKTHLKINGLTGSPVPNSVFHPQAGGYGGVIDRLGHLWSSDDLLLGVGNLLWLRPSSNLPPLQGTDWQALTDQVAYGIAVDPLHSYLWQTSATSVFRWHTNGTPVTNANGQVILYPHGFATSQGLAVDGHGHIWVAHGRGESRTVGHLDTNGTWLGNVPLQVAGLAGQYFANTNATGVPVFTRVDGPVNFDWGAGSPDVSVPTNYFSARWSGRVQSRTEGEYTFYVSADAGAGFRLSVGQTTLIDNWDNPNPNPVELSQGIWLNASNDYRLVLEYKEAVDEARVRLSWREPSPTNQVDIPGDRMVQLGAGPTGVSVDSVGKIWAANWNSNSVMRIDPNAGVIVVTNGVTNHVGAVDWVVDLGDGSSHPEPYNVAAAPYNYSDMTGFNNRIVNPGLQPLKGYWTVMDDSGQTDEIWERVAWSNNLPIAGCSMEVFVRASNNRQSLANEPFVSVSNDVPPVDVRGRYIEVRAALTRDDPSKQPVLYDLTLYASSSAFVGDSFLEDQGVSETSDAFFYTDLIGPEPLIFQWAVMYPWTNQFQTLAAQTNWYLLWTNADLWEDFSLVSLSVSNAAGQTLSLGPAVLSVWPLPMNLPATNSSGPAQRYPATINVRGEPTSGLARVEVTLAGLTHYYPADLDILLVSPSGTNIMLMSDAGSSFAVTNATLVFRPVWLGDPYPPENSAIPSSLTVHYRASNFGDQETQLPDGPLVPYSTELDDLTGTDANGLWKLYIYDDKTGRPACFKIRGV